jgi:L-lactate dehydrogenase
MDLAHGTMFTGTSDITGGADLEAVRGSHVVVITAGAKQKPGQTRLDLAGVNAGIMHSLMPQLLEVAPGAIYVVVTNPCDVLTSMAVKDTGLPPEQLFSSGTLLDSSRLRLLLAKRTGVSTSSVHAWIVGEHGDSEFPLWHSSTIGHTPVLEWIPEHGEPVTEEELETIADDVRGAAYAVIRGKGATNYAIGLSSARIVEAVLKDEHAIMPVSTLLHDYKGIDGVALSVPCVVSARGAVPIPTIPFSEAELASLRTSAGELARVQASLSRS